MAPSVFVCVNDMLAGQPYNRPRALNGSWVHRENIVLSTGAKPAAVLQLHECIFIGVQATGCIDSTKE